MPANQFSTALGTSPEDAWHGSYSGAPADGSAWTDGRGKESLSVRVNRGGSWDYNPIYLRAANRVMDVRDNRLNYFGFRVARTLD